MTLATQLQPTRTRGTPSKDGDFVVFEHVCVFDEHVGDDGVRYDERLLRHIAENCNRRIRTTKDWCPVVVGHTRDNEDKRAANDDPEVIGLAGPFYVSDWVNGEGRPVKAIFATFWIFPDKEKAFLRNPRRSVEIWPEEKPEDRYFDPLACLGAETPKRDLGMIYSRRRPGLVPSCYAVPGPLRYSKRYRGTPPIRYEATCAGGGAGQNTFIASTTNLRNKPQKNEKGADSMNPDDLSQLAEALKPMIQAMVEDAVVAVQSSEPTEIAPDTTGEMDDLGADDLGGLDEALPAGGGGLPPGGPGAPTPTGLDAPGGDVPLGGPPLDAPGGDAPLGDEMPPEEPLPEGEEDFDSLPDEDQAYAKGLGRKFMKYRRGDDDSDDWDDDGADKFVGSLDDEDTGMLDKFMKYANSCSKCKKRYAERYGKDWEEDEADKKEGEPDRYAAGATPPVAPPVGKPKPAPFTPGKYGKSNMALKYRKLVTDHEQLKQRYSKLSAEHESATKELTELRVAERYAKRYARLKDLETEGYCFDPAEEMELTEDLSDEQFDRHSAVIIPQRYSRVSGSAFPVERERKLTALADQKPAQYAKPARQIVEKYRKQGRELNYGTVLNYLISHEGQVDEAELLKNGNGKA